MAFYVALSALACSVVGNIVLAYFFARKSRKKEPTLSLSAEDLLHDLTRGPAVVRIEVIDAKSLFVRSPRT